MEVLREIRRQRGLSQSELSRATGVAQNTISEIERGHRDAHPSTLRKLARALGVEVAELFREPALPKAEAPQDPGQPVQLLEKQLNRMSGVMDRLGRDLAATPHALPPDTTGVALECMHWRPQLAAMYGGLERAGLLTPQLREAWVRYDAAYERLSPRLAAAWKGPPDAAEEANTAGERRPETA